VTTLRNWKTVERKQLFAGGPVREVAVESVLLPDGRTVPDYYVIRLPDYVLIYAEMADGTVPMLRQYKHGPRRVCLTFPGGAIEADESPLDAARRELREELGCEARDWHSLGAFVTNANQGCNSAHLFRAVGCTQVAEPCSGDLEETVVAYFDRSALLAPGRVAEIGLASHVALLLLAAPAHPGV
jgi:ADP-ribose pyrophosphatase